MPFNEKRTSKKYINEIRKIKQYNKKTDAEISQLITDMQKLCEIIVELVITERSKNENE